MTTKVTVNGQEFDFDAVVNLMDDDLRNQLHDDIDIFGPAGTTPQQFADDYCVVHARKFGSRFVVN